MNFYNENDPKTAAWLRELIAAGHIAPGVVDARSILEIKPHELESFTQCHFFAGIGGWSLALRLAGWCDDRPVWTGSCPCQPFSCAGKGQVDKDERHLWPAFREHIAVRQPSVCFGEQTAGTDGRIWLAGVRADLEALGYGVGAADLCAAGIGAPNIRQRLYWVAYANSGRFQQCDPSKRTIPKSDAGGGLVQSNGARRLAWQSPAPPAGHGRPVEPAGDSGGVENAHVGRCGSGSGRESETTQSQSGHGLTEQRGCAGGMEHPASDGRQQRGTEPGGWCPCQRCRAGRLGETNLPRLQVGQENQKRADALPEPLASIAWSNFDNIRCADGKSRRVESGTFPLAHGVPGRVGLLRGYGNAIVPQLAAEFIKACQEALNP